MAGEVAGDAGSFAKYYAANDPHLMTPEEWEIDMKKMFRKEID